MIEPQPWWRVTVSVGREQVVVGRLSWGDAHQVEVALMLVLTGVGAVEADGLYQVGAVRIAVEMEAENGR